MHRGKSTVGGAKPPPPSSSKGDLADRYPGPVGWRARCTVSGDLYSGSCVIASRSSPGPRMSPEGARGRDPTAIPRIRMKGQTMMNRIYLKARAFEKVRQLIDELLDERVEPGQILVHAAEKPRGADLPVTLIIHRTLAQASIEGGALGALFASPVSVALWLVGDTVLGVLALILGAGVGGVFTALRALSANRSIAPQSEALRRGELLLVVTVDHAAIGPVQDRIKARHPEVAVLGSDPAGTPQFP